MVFEICKRTDRQTDRHTDTLIAILRTSIVVEEKDLCGLVE